MADRGWMLRVQQQPTPPGAVAAVPRWAVSTVATPRHPSGSGEVLPRWAATPRSSVELPPAAVTVGQAHQAHQAQSRPSVVTQSPSPQLSQHRHFWAATSPRQPAVAAPCNGFKAAPPGSTTNTASLAATAAAAAHAACSNSGSSNKPAAVREEVSAYKIGDLVEYWSVTKGGSWVSATVVGVGSDSQLVLDVKPHAWISCQEQATKLRPRGSLGTQQLTATGAAPSNGGESGAGGKCSSLGWAAPMLGGRTNERKACRSPSPVFQAFRSMSLILEENAEDLKDSSSELSYRKSDSQKSSNCRLSRSCEEQLQEEYPDSHDLEELNDNRHKFQEQQEQLCEEEPCGQHFEPGRNAEDQQGLMEHDQKPCEGQKPQGEQAPDEQHSEHVEDQQELIEHEQELCEGRKPPGEQELGEQQMEPAEDQLELIEHEEKPCEGQEQSGELERDTRQLQLGELQHQVTEHQEEPCKELILDGLEPCRQQLPLGEFVQQLSEHSPEPCEQQQVLNKYEPGEQQAVLAQHQQRELCELLQEPVEQPIPSDETEPGKQHLQHSQCQQELRECRNELCEQQQQTDEQQPVMEGPSEHQLAHSNSAQDTPCMREREREHGVEPIQQAVSMDAPEAAASGSSRRSRRWTLANVAEHRVVGAAVRRLHEVLVAQRPSVDLLELPKRPDGSSLVMQASFYRRLLGGRLEVKGCLESDISAAHMDLKHLTLEQLVSIRAESLDFLTSSESHSTHNNFLDSVDGYLAERLVQHGLQGRAQAPAAALRALGRRLVLALGAGQLLRQGWGSSSAGGAGSRTGLSSGIGHLPHHWAVELDAALWPSGGAHKAALFFAEPQPPSEQHGSSGSSGDLFRVELPGSGREAWARAAGEGNEVAIACDSSWGIGKGRRLQWEICAVDPRVDDIAVPGEAACASMSQQQALAKALAAKAMEGSSSPQPSVLEGLLSKVPRPLGRASTSVSGSREGASSSAARLLSAVEAPPPTAATEDAGSAESAGGRCPRPSVAYLSGRVGLAVARLNLPAN